MVKGFSICKPEHVCSPKKKKGGKGGIIQRRQHTSGVPKGEWFSWKGRKRGGRIDGRAAVWLRIG